MQRRRRDKNLDSLQITEVHPNVWQKISKTHIDDKNRGTKVRSDDNVYVDIIVNYRITTKTNTKTSQTEFRLGELRL